MKWFGAWWNTVFYIQKLDDRPGPNLQNLFSFVPNDTLWGYCNIGCPPETHLKLKYRDLSFIQNPRFSFQIALKLRTGYGSDTAVLCAKFQNDLTTKQ